jgi:hypothetical protein
MADEIRRTERTTGLQSWSDEGRWWRENYSTRPYVDRTRPFEDYEPGYRYGYESAERLGSRPWEEVEPDLRAGWDRYENRGESTWDEIKDSVRDAWDRLTGKGRSRTDL